MTPMKRMLFMMVAVALVSVSCKNKNAASMLEGTWYETKINGQDNPPSNQDQITFGKCKGGDNASCDLTVTDCCGGGSFNYDYTVTDKGETLVLKQCQGIVCASTYHTIKNLTENSMEIDWDFGSNSQYSGTYEKQ